MAPAFPTVTPTDLGTVLVEDESGVVAVGRLSLTTEHDGAIVAVPVRDTLKRGTALIEATVAREHLWRAQTPQAFRYAAILEAHRAAAGESLSDDAAVAERAGLAVALIEGRQDNLKVTTADDLALAERLLATAGEMRIGSGFDVHRFAAGDHVMLGGVRIAHDRLQEQLQGYLTSSRYRDAIQEPIITLRDGRYVIPVKAERRSDVRGIVHDVSASGATVFLEPLPDRRVLVGKLDLVTEPILDLFRPTLELHRRMKRQVPGRSFPNVEVLVEPTVWRHEQACLLPGKHYLLLPLLPHYGIPIPIRDHDDESRPVPVGFFVGAFAEDRHVGGHL